MRRMLSVAGSLFLVFLLSAGQSGAFAFRSIEVGSEAPDFTLPSVDGKQVSLNFYDGKIVILMLWATDTESKEERSIDLLRTLESVYQEHKNEGVVVLAVNCDNDAKKKVAGIIEQTGITYPVLLDEKAEVYGSYGVFILPTVGVIGKDGTLKGAFGYTHDIDKIVDGEIQVLLGLKTREELEKELAPEEVVEKSKELKDAERHFNLGRVMVERRLFDQAKKEFEKAAEFDPNRVDVRVELGILLVKTGEYDEALTQLVKALELDPDSAKAHSGVGLAYLHKGQLDEAIDELEWASEINPRSARTFYQLGIAYEKKGDRVKALEQYKKALRLIFKDG